ncbi:MAG TPA: indolepyruvate oxidoreductase subunit beta [Clostridiaceae bacterium]|nr:indolepyruvate oxidoreductase subunit beta [Clostridiaceae bacterium]
METRNIIIAGVGGQGLVLATKLIAEAAFKAGLDVKTNDVVGLSQRGGMVYGTVKFGEKVYSPNILPKSGDVLLGMEPLEAYRWSHNLKDGAVIIMNTKRVYPTPALLEKEPYPEAEIEALKDTYQVVEIDAMNEAKASGNIKAANTILIGLLARYLDIDTRIWEEVLRENVPEKAIEENIVAFRRGYRFGQIPEAEVEAASTEEKYLL